MSRYSASYARRLRRSYLTASKPATLTIGGSLALSLDVIEMTHGATVGEGMSGTETVLPSVRCKTADIAASGFEPVDLVDATLEIDCVVWKVSRTAPFKQVSSSLDGQTVLILVEPDV